MGNWSINPNTLASIDDNGKATFQEHTQDTNYTITYNDGTSGNITKTFTVYACSQPPVDCSKYEFSNVGGEVSSSGGVVSMGYSSTAEADLSFSSEKSDSWITFSHIQRSRVYKAYMCTIAQNEDSEERFGYAVFTSTDGCEFSGTVTQKAVEWVDLGLPSGKLWRAWNVGSSLEIEYGNYYQYGKGSRQYAATSAETSYTGTENPLSSSLDAATQALNNANVHMPTVTEYKELTANTTYSNVTINGISGGKFTSSNGNYIFLPFGGEYNNGTKELVGSRGCYLSSTPNGSTNINRINVNSNGTYYDGNYRTLGLMVRPVSGTTTDTCTCNQINVSITELNISADSALTQVGIITTNDCISNVTYESTQPTWLSGVTYISNDIRIKCSENTTYNSRSGSVNIKMNGNTCSTVNVTQEGKPTPQTSVSTNLIISDGSSGGLRVTGSTYTAEFIIAGPNAGTGTLHGTLTADTRDKMTFAGEWDGSPGATIFNSCPGSAPQGLYTIGDAHWDLSTKTLHVNLVQCKQ